MRQIAQYIKYLQSSKCTHRTVYSYKLIHMIISAFGVYKHDPVARLYSLGQHFEV